MGKQISNQIVPKQSFQSYLTSPTNKRFKLMEVDDNEIMRIVNNLKINQVMDMIAYPIYY